MSDIRQQLVCEARRWLGVRYRHCGRDQRGVDCYGLIRAVMLQVLGHCPEDVAYSHTPSSALAFRVIAKCADRIGARDARPGDLVLMNYAGRSTHIAMLTDRGVIHSNAIWRRVVEHTINDDLQHRIVGYFRLKGVAPCS